MFNYNIVVDPLSLYSVVETEMEVGGNLEKGVFIPYEGNMTKTGSKWKLRLKLSQILNQYTKNKASHVLIQKLGKEEFKRLLALNKVDRPPIIGNGYIARKKSTYTPNKNIDDVLGSK